MEYIYLFYKCLKLMKPKWEYSSVEYIIIT